MTDKYKYMSDKIVEQVLKDYGVEIKVIDNNISLKTENCTMAEHSQRFAGLMSVNSLIYEYVLMLSLSMADKEGGVITLNSIRDRAIEMINYQTNISMDNYLSGNVDARTKLEEASNDG